MIHVIIPPGPASSITLRDDTGHTIKVSTRGVVPTNGCLCDGQSAIPAHNIVVEDLGYGFQTKVAAGTFPPKHLEEQAVPAELPGTNDPFTGRGYQAARGCAPAPAGAPKAEDVIALGRGKQAEATIERLNPLLAGGEHHEGADPSATCPECHADRRVLDKKMRSGIWDIIPYYDARASITSCPACREWWLKGGHITEATSGTLAKAAVSNIVAY